MSEKSYDLVVIGSGPAGEKGAAQAAYFGKKVALIEKETELGGAAANTGTLPSKTLRETSLYLSGFTICDPKIGNSYPKLSANSAQLLVVGMGALKVLDTSPPSFKLPASEFGVSTIFAFVFNG